MNEMAVNMSNNMTNSSCGKFEADFCNGSAILNDISDDKLELHILISSLILLLSTMMIIIFNGVLLYCILMNKKKQWVRNAQQIVYLILSDFIVGLLFLPRNALIFLRSTGLSYSTCAMYSYMFITTQSVSFYHIMAVCIHRFRMANRIHTPMGMDRYNYGRESLLIWIGVLVAFVPPYMLWGRHGEIIYKCLLGYIFGPEDTGSKIYMLVLYIIPWITTNTLYIFVLFKVKKSLKRVHSVNSTANVSTIANVSTVANVSTNHGSFTSQNPPTSTSQNALANKKILRTVGLLLLTFNASLIVSIVIVIGTFYETVIPRIVQSFVLINNICNPFIYLSASSMLKKEAYLMLSNFRCKLPWNRQI